MKAFEERGRASERVGLSRRREARGGKEGGGEIFETNTRNKNKKMRAYFYRLKTLQQYVLLLQFGA